VPGYGIELRERRIVRHREVLAATRGNLAVHLQNWASFPETNPASRALSRKGELYRRAAWGDGREKFLRHNICRHNILTFAACA
jgi:hypothetical protein